MRKVISMILVVITLLSMVSVVALAEEQPVIVVDGVKDAVYSDKKMIDSSYWGFFDRSYTVEPIDPERVKNTLWFTWDDTHIYLYFQAESKDTLRAPKKGEVNPPDRNMEFYEQINVYLDTAPSFEYLQQCTQVSYGTLDDKTGEPVQCNHFCCASNTGEAKNYRLMARSTPAWNIWNSYYRSDEGMFMTYEEFLAKRCDPNSGAYDASYIGNEEQKYLESNGNKGAKAVSFIDYETNTYGFEMSYPRYEGEEYFQFNIALEVNEKDWEFEGPELGYGMAICKNGWLNSDELLEIYYADYSADQETEVVSTDFQYAISGEEATITGYTGAGGAVTIPAQINGTPVVAIGNKAFANQNSVTSVTLPTTLKTIGNRAFYGCTSLTALEIPQGVQVVEDYAFCGCSSLKTIAIPASVTTMNYSVFTSCSALETVTVSQQNPNFCAVDGVLFNKQQTTLIQYPACKTATSYAVPNSVKTIGEEAFYGAKNLTKITLPATLNAIEGYAFYDCSNLRNITLPTGVTSLGESVFFNCDRLVSVTIPAGITTLPYATFGGCSGLTAIELPSGLTAIDEYAFYDCSNLSTVAVPASVNTIASSAFIGCNSALVLLGKEGSYVETYANNNGLAFEIWDEAPSQKDVNAAKEVEDLIKSLPETVTISTQSLIELCRDKYDVLTLTGKSLVTNYAKLEQAEKDLADIKASSADYEAAAKNVVNLIDTLPEVITKDYQSLIELCRTKYSMLSEIAKEFVTNYDKLQKAEKDLTALLQKEIDEAAAKKVDDLITKLPVEVTEENKHLVDEAQAAYESLTENQQALVTRKGELMIAITAKKVLNLIALINSLPAVITKADTQAVAAAREAYNALGATEQAMITNYNALVEAEETVQNLQTVTYGDVNADGSVNAKDALMVLKAAVEKEEFSSMQKTAAEVDRKEGINAKDALEILKFAVSKIKLFPVEVIQ